MTPAQEFKLAKSIEPMTTMELIGSFNVRILSGPFKIYKTMSWKKSIYTSSREGVIGQNEIQEYNIFKEPAPQGYFNVEFATDHLVLNYDNAANEDSFWLRMKDYVRKTAFPGEYIGKIYIKVGWVYWPAGYFSLSRIQGGCNATCK